MLDHLLQGLQAAVVHVGGGPLDVADRRGLERPELGVGLGADRPSAQRPRSANFLVFSSQPTPRLWNCSSVKLSPDVADGALGLLQLDARA